MPYRCRMDTLIAKVIGGMAPKESSSGRHKHSPASCAVLHAKQGKHQKARQPKNGEKKNNPLSVFLVRARKLNLFVNSPKVRSTSQGELYIITACSTFQTVWWKFNHLWCHMSWELPPAALSGQFLSTLFLCISKHIELPIQSVKIVQWIVKLYRGRIILEQKRSPVSNF